MPIGPTPVSDIGAPVGTPADFSVTPGYDDVTLGQDAPIERPSWSDTIAAAFRMDNTIGSAIASETNKTSDYLDPDFDPWQRIKGTALESHWDRFVDVHNARRFSAVVDDINRENEDRKTLAISGFGGTVAGLAAGILDIPTLLPGGAVVRGGSLAGGIAKSALSLGLSSGVATGLQEAELNATQQTRTPAESLVPIAGSVILGGLLGAAGSRLLAPAEFKAAAEELDRQMREAAPAAEVGEVGTPAPLVEDGPVAPASAGAAAVTARPLEETAIAGRAASAVAAASKPIAPGLRLMQSPSAEVRNVAANLIENPLYLKAHFAGEDTGQAAETLMQEWNGGLATALQATGDAFSAYRKGGGKLNRPLFNVEVAKAMRRGDTSDIPEVAQAAKAHRDAVYDPLKNAAIETGQIPEDVEVKTADSYLSRLWNRNRIIAQEPVFKALTTSYYERQMAKEFDESATHLEGRLSRIEQEQADLQLSPEARTAALGDIESRLSQMEATNPGHVERADQIAELTAQARAAKQAGNEAGQKAALAQARDLRKAGGEDFAKFVQERGALRTRRGNVDLGQAGLAERSAEIENRLADLDEANRRSMARLVKKGQAFAREAQRLDPELLQERISQLRDAFADVGRRADGAAERTAKAIERMRGQEGADEAVLARLEKERKAQDNRAVEMSRLAARLEAAEGFDREGAMAELHAAVGRLEEEVSQAALARGERAQRMLERLERLDPGRIKDRVAALEKMKAELSRAFEERWETTRGAFDVNREARTANFSERAKEIAQEVFDTLSGKFAEGTRPEFIKINTRGPMKDRTFNIPDTYSVPGLGSVEDFLENDIDKITRRYVRVMGADVEIARKFGSPDMKAAFDRVRTDYQRRRETAMAETDGRKREKLLAGLDKAEKADVRDLAAMRDLLRGTYHPHEWEKNFAKIARAAMQYNFVRSLGNVTLSSLTDAPHVAMARGLMPYLGMLPKFAAGVKGVKMSVKEAQLAGNVLERILKHRLATIAEITDPYTAQGPIGRFLDSMANAASNWNGIRLWTDIGKSMAAVLTQDRILGNAMKGFGKLSKRERSYMAMLGLGEGMTERIAKEFSEHGEIVDGVRVANTEDWTDAVARRAYRAAMNKDIDSIIVERGVGDSPLFANTPAGKLILQFKGYALASHQRVLLRGMQEGPARFVGGVVGMTIVGMMQLYLKALAGNYLATLPDMGENPGWWVGEGLDQSGVFSIPMEVANAAEKLTGAHAANFIKFPLEAVLGDDANQESFRIRGYGKTGVFGPTAGLFDKIATAAGVPFTTVSGQQVSRSQRSAAIGLIPFNTYPGLHQMLKYVIDPPMR